MQIPGSEKLLEVASGADRGNRFANLLKKTGLSKAAMSSFGEPELLDDLVDHWNAGNHKEVYICSYRCLLTCGMQHCSGVPRSILFPSASCSVTPGWTFSCTSSLLYLFAVFVSIC